MEHDSRFCSRMQKILAVNTHQFHLLMSIPSSFLFFSPMNSIRTVNAFPCRIRFDCQKKKELISSPHLPSLQTTMLFLPKHLILSIHKTELCASDTRCDQCVCLCLNDDEKEKRKIKNNGKREKRRDFLRITKQPEHKLSFSCMWFFFLFFGCLSVY